MYRSEQSKLAAFQFRDPFAADQYCFPETQQKVIDWQDGSHVAIDLDLLLDTVRHVNHDINFFPPLLEEDSRKTDLLRQFIWESTNKKLKQKLLTGVPYRASPKGSDTMMQPTSPESVNLTKNEFDRLKLIDMACRHIALAASSTVPEVCTPHAELLSTESSHGKRSGSNSSKKQRRRRGGVLGFKELAAKSNLSPWHFHRVFKSVTGLTPKNYGDRCCEYIKQQAKGSGGTRIVVINTRIANPTMAAEDSQQNINSGSHRTDSHLESSVSPVQHSSLASSPVSAPSVMSTSPTTTTKSSKTPLFHTEDADEESWQPVKYRKISAEGWSPSDDPLAGLRPEESLAEANLEDLVSMLPRPFDISDPSAISLPNAPTASETILAADVWQQQQHQQQQLQLQIQQIQQQRQPTDITSDRDLSASSVPTLQNYLSRQLDAGNWDLFPSESRESSSNGLSQRTESVKPATIGAGRQYTTIPFAEPLYGLSDVSSTPMTSQEQINSSNLTNDESLGMYFAASVNDTPSFVSPLQLDPVSSSANFAELLAVAPHESVPLDASTLLGQQSQETPSQQSRSFYLTSSM